MDKTYPSRKPETIITSEVDECIATVRKTIADATTLELNGNWEKALQKLESVRKEAEQILAQAPSTSEHSTTSPNDPRSVRQEILDHIKLCNEKLALYTEVMAPPSYEEAMSTNSSTSSDYADGQNLYSATTNSSATNLSYNELGAMLENLKADTRAQSAELIYTCSGVTLYFISNSGRVSVSNGPDTARIFEIAEGGPTAVPKYYLQIYTYVYPLVKQVSPCIRTEFGAILLPNINVDQSIDVDNQSIGLVIPKDHEDEFILILENILGTKIVFCNTKEPEHVGTSITNTIVSGAESVSNFLVQSAQKAEQFMDGNTPKIIEKINPGDRHRRVAPCVKSGIRIAKDVTAVTANVTGFVASKVGAATMSLGQFLAPHIRRSGGRILSQTTGMNESKACEKVNSIMNVTAGAVEGLGTVYNGLETSARIFGRSLSNNTVQIVQHRYGPPAAEFTQDTFETVSNGIEIGTHIRMFKPKNLAKSTARGVVGTACRTTATDEQSRKSSTSTTAESWSSQTDGSKSKSPLVEVEENNKKSGEHKPGRPAVFSSEILIPTVVSPSSEMKEAVQSAVTEATSSSSKGSQNLLS